MCIFQSSWVKWKVYKIYISKRGLTLHPAVSPVQWSPVPTLENPYHGSALIARRLQIYNGLPSRWYNSSGYWFWPWKGNIWFWSLSLQRHHSYLVTCCFLHYFIPCCYLLRHSTIKVAALVCGCQTTLKMHIYPRGYKGHSFFMMMS